MNKSGNSPETNRCVSCQKIISNSAMNKCLACFEWKEDQVNNQIDNQSQVGTSKSSTGETLKSYRAFNILSILQNKLPDPTQKSENSFAGEVSIHSPKMERYFHFDPSPYLQKTQSELIDIIKKLQYEYYQLKNRRQQEQEELGILDQRKMLASDRSFLSAKVPPIKNKDLATKYMYKKQQPVEQFQETSQIQHKDKEEPQENEQVEEQSEFDSNNDPNKSSEVNHPIGSSRVASSKNKIQLGEKIDREEDLNFLDSQNISMHYSTYSQKDSGIYLNPNNLENDSQHSKNPLIQTTPTLPNLVKKASESRWKKY